MPDELRRCMVGCCRLANNQAVTPEEYQSALQRDQPGFNLASVETVIPCRKIRVKVQEAAEISAGFYLGTPVGPPFGKSPRVFNRATGNFLREATDADIQRWRVGHLFARRGGFPLIDHSASAMNPLG